MSKLQTIIPLLAASMMQEDFVPYEYKKKPKPTGKRSKAEKRKRKLARKNRRSNK